MEPRQARDRATGEPFGPPLSRKRKAKAVVDDDGKAPMEEDMIDEERMDESPPRRYPQAEE